MDWREVKIYTAHEGVEPLTGLLLGLGITGFAVEDAQDFAEFLQQATPHWDYVDESLERLRDCETCLTLYLAENAQGADTFAQLQGELRRLRLQGGAQRYGRLEIEDKQVHEEDWANNWKQYFHPLPVGERLLIKPSWADLAPGQAAGRTVLELDPSASFGTGTHATTRLCLELLEGCVRGGESLLDMGCGSGILGVAAMLLGAREAVAVDIDENAVRIARENYERNAADLASVRFFCGDVNGDEALRRELACARYDVVVANIVADVIIAMLPFLLSCMGQQGELLLSGIIDARESDVRAALPGELRIAERREDGGWVALRCRRAGAPGDE